MDITAVTKTHGIRQVGTTKNFEVVELATGTVSAVTRGAWGATKLAKEASGQYGPGSGYSAATMARGRQAAHDREYSQAGDEEWEQY